MAYALVTGASSGIGYAYAEALAQRGYNLVIVSNEAEELAEKERLLQERYPTIVVRSLLQDLGHSYSAREVYNWCKDGNVDVEVLVNNAGVYHDRDYLDDSETFNQLILQLHVTTPSMLTYYFGQDMKARGRGYILNMSSVTSNFAAQRLATYSATKGYLRFFSRSTHIELKQHGINVCCVRPGAVATGLYNLRPSALRWGLRLGYIITPQALAQKGLRALFRGKAEVTPGLSTKALEVVVRLIPTCLLRFIRRRGWF